LKRIGLLSLFVLGIILFVAACSDEDPVVPPPPPPGDPSPVSPDSLMSLFRLAMVDRDAELYESLLHPEFRMFLGPEEVSDFVLVDGTDHLKREEAVRAAESMFAGLDVTNWTGRLEPGVTQIIVHEWIKTSEWAFGKDGPEEIPNTLVSLWTLRMFVERGSGHLTLSAAGDYQFQVAKVDTGETYLLKRIMSVADTKADNTTGFAGIHLHYLTNEPPTATFEVTETPGVPWPTYRFDAGASRDDDGGLASYPFRWRLGEGTEWTDWWWHPVDHVFESEEVQVVTLEVRDRWGAMTQATKSVSPVKTWLPFPDTPDQLMANFQGAYELMDIAELRRIIHPDFQMILQQETVDQFPGIGSTIDAVEELRIGERMFSGEDLADPDTGALIPGIEVEARLLRQCWPRVRYAST